MIWIEAVVEQGMNHTVHTKVLGPRRIHFGAGCTYARMSVYAHSYENSRPYGQPGQAEGTVEKVVLECPDGRFYEIEMFLYRNNLNFDKKPHPAKGGVHSSVGFSTRPKA